MTATMNNHHDSRPPEAWRGDFAAVRLETHTRPDGRPYEQTVITIGTGAGVMVVPTTLIDEVQHVGMVRQSRPTNGGTTGHEFPRGGCPAPTRDQAVRILERETGLVADMVAELGSFYPENGMVDLVVGVYACLVDPTAALAATGLTDPDTGAVFEWVPATDVNDLVRRGSISDGITLAAWALVSARVHL